MAWMGKSRANLELAADGCGKQYMGHPEHHEGEDPGQERTCHFAVELLLFFFNRLIALGGSLVVDRIFFGKVS